MAEAHEAYWRDRAMLLLMLLKWYEEEHGRQGAEILALRKTLDDPTCTEPPDLPHLSS